MNGTLTGARAVLVIAGVALLVLVGGLAGRWSAGDTAPAPSPRPAPTVGTFLPGSGAGTGGGSLCLTARPC